jgi:uncharacterized membrane protein YfcA
VATSAGIATFEVLQLTHGGSVAPEWILGISMGLGGFAGSYAGARLQSHLPETSLRRLLGLIACLVAGRYTQTAIQQSSSPRQQVAVEPSGHPRGHQKDKSRLPC